jgi:hypothetical protein
VAYVSGVQRTQLLEHAEEIQLAQQVQRLLQLESLYVERVDLPHKGRRGSAAGRVPSAAEAVANVSIRELREQLSTGLQARDRIVESNIGLVRNAIYKLKSARLNGPVPSRDARHSRCERTRRHPMR